MVQTQKYLNKIKSAEIKLKEVFKVYTMSDTIKNEDLRLELNIEPVRACVVSCS